MRIVALGAGGGMGRYAVRTAATFACVEQIVVVDRDEARAREVADNWVGEKGVSARADITDLESLKHLLDQADVVLNTTGPFYMFGPSILEAAIDSSCHYLDICDDWEPTLDMLAMDGEARKAGITAVLGMGASPGITNLLAVKAAQALDSTLSLITGWGESTDDPEGLEELQPGTGGSFRAAYDHWLKQVSGAIRVLEGGEFVATTPLQEIPVVFPGSGTRIAHTVGHPEPVTLPRRYPELKASYNVMVLPGEVIALLFWLRRRIDSGRTSIAEATALVQEAAERLTPDPRSRRPQWEATKKGLAWLAGKLARRQMGMEDALRFIRAPKDVGPNLPVLFACAEGIKDGGEAYAAASLASLPAGSMGGMTGIPLALGLDMLGSGIIERRGVFAPEDVIDPDAFFDRLAPLCSPQADGAGALLKVVQSP
ncbi:MAG: saccharopine dehydrogenase [Actinobacteria bacterium]|nr:MAG: saccharopine dehydrogenase [Actinomycetota bacterium]